MNKVKNTLVLNALLLAQQMPGFVKIILVQRTFDFKLL